MTLLGKIALLVLIGIIHEYWDVPIDEISNEVQVVFWVSLAVFALDEKKSK